MQQWFPMFFGKKYVPMQEIGEELLKTIESEQVVEGVTIQRIGTMAIMGTIMAYKIFLK